MFSLFLVTFQHSFSALIFMGVSGGHVVAFLAFFDTPGHQNMRVFLITFNTFPRFSEYARTVLPLQRELDLEGSGGSQNHIFLMLFRVLVSKAFFDNMFSIFCVFL